MRVKVQSLLGKSLVSRKQKQCLGKVVSAIAVIGGISLVLGGCSGNSSSTSTSEFSDEEIKNYARTILAIEPIRQSAYKEIQQISKSDKVPFIACGQRDSIASLSQDVQEIAMNYCNQSQKIGESNGLTMSRFNTVTMKAQSDLDLQKQIQNELVQMQQ